MSDCEKNCEAVAGLNEYAANLIEYSKRIDKWVNGGQNEFVQVGGVDTPTLRNLAMMIKALMGVHPDNKTIFINEDKEIYVNLRNIIQVGGGIDVDANNKLYIDFTKMPTDKFDALLKSIQVPIWLNGNTDFYVNNSHPNAGDDLVEGRGTIDYPFMTIQAAVKYVTEFYNMINFTATIRIAAGTYNENLSLGAFSRTTGSVIITTYLGQEGQVNINTKYRNGIYVSGGPYLLINLNLTHIPTYSDNVWSAIHLLNVDTSGDITVRACKLNLSNLSGLTAANYEIRMIGVYDGKFSTNASASGERQMSFNLVKPSSHTARFIFGESGANIQVSATNLSQAANTIQCTGSCTEFIYLSNASFTRVGGATYPTAFSGTVTGKRYSIAYGATCLCGGSPSYFPGNTDGTVQVSTYSWYA